MTPPWLEYPEYEFGSLGWRMGAGEGYLDTFIQWLRQQDDASLNEYFSRNTPPAEWDDFVDYQLSRIKESSARG